MAGEKMNNTPPIIPVTAPVVESQARQGESMEIRKPSLDISSLQSYLNPTEFAAFKSVFEKLPTDKATHIAELLKKSPSLWTRIKENLEVIVELWIADTSILDGEVKATELANTNKNKEVVAQNKKVVAQNKKVVALNDKTKEKSASDQLTEATKQIDEKVKKIYNIFGGKETFEKKFPDYGKWKVEVENNLLKAEHPGKSETELAEIKASPEFQARVDMAIMVIHEAEIAKGLSLADKAKFEAQIREANSYIRQQPSLTGLCATIDLRNAKISKGNKEVILQSIQHESGAKLEKYGSTDNIYKYGKDQIFIIKDGSVEKRILAEGERAISVPVKLPDQNEKYENLAKLEALKTEKNSLENLLTGKDKKWGKYSELKQKVTEIENEEKRREEHEKNWDTSHGDVKESAQWKSSNANIDKLVKIEIPRLQEEIKKIEEKLEQVNEKIQSLEKQEQGRIPRFREQAKEWDDVARKNLKFLESLGFWESLPQSTLNGIIQFINQNRDALMAPLQIKDNPPFDLTRSITDWDKNEMRLWMRTMEHLLEVPEGTHFTYEWEPKTKDVTKLKTEVKNKSILDKKSPLNIDNSIQQMERTQVLNLFTKKNESTKATQEKKSESPKPTSEAK